MYSGHKVEFFFISAKFCFGLLDFSLKLRDLLPSVRTSIFLSCERLIPMPYDAIVYIAGQKIKSLHSQFLARIALLLTKDQARPFVLYALLFFPLYQPKDLKPTYPS